ncbi:MAG: DUF2807 domain-containing protein [Tidjanibacter sp.]|nr:DUF2807 domain-containing protein [Tidjanibacter sp.]
MKKFLLLLGTLTITMCAVAGYQLSRGADRGLISITYNGSESEGEEEVIIAGNAPKKSESRTVNPFHTIVTGTAINVAYTAASNYSMVVEADKRVLDNVKTEVRDGVLYISYTGKVAIRNSNQTTIHLTGRDLREVRASASSDVVLNMAKSSPVPEFRMKISSAADLVFDHLYAHEVNIALASTASITGEIREAQKVDIDLSSASELKLSGTCHTLRVDASSSADADLENLKAVVADVDASSAASVTVWVSESLTADASSAADILYRGEQGVTIDADTSSAGTVGRLR